MGRSKSSAPAPDAALDPRRAAVLARDARADEQFVYAVRTTGIYCRASSVPRLPRPENVLFFDNASDAEAAGLRPSTRSAADQTHLPEQHAALVARACRQIADAEQAPSLNQLAELAGMSPWHFHRVFKTLTGVTPKAYASAHRADRIRT